MKKVIRALVLCQSMLLLRNEYALGMKREYMTNSYASVQEFCKLTLDEQFDEICYRLIGGKHVADDGTPYLVAGLLNYSQYENAQKEIIDLLDIYTRNGGDINKKTLFTENTLLHFAVTNNAQLVQDWLLKCNADQTAKNKKGVPAIDGAYCGKSKEYFDGNHEDLLDVCKILLNGNMQTMATNERLRFQVYELQKQKKDNVTILRKNSELTKKLDTLQKKYIELQNEVKKKSGTINDQKNQTDTLLAKVQQWEDFEKSEKYQAFLSFKQQQDMVRKVEEAEQKKAEEERKKQEEFAHKEEKKRKYEESEKRRKAEIKRKQQEAERKAKEEAEKRRKVEAERKQEEAKQQQEAERKAKEEAKKRRKADEKRKQEEDDIAFLQQIQKSQRNQLSINDIRQRLISLIDDLNSDNMRRTVEIDERIKSYIDNVFTFKKQLSDLSEILLTANNDNYSLACYIWGNDFASDCFLKKIQELKLKKDDVREFLTKILIASNSKKDDKGKTISTSKNISLLMSNSSKEVFELLNNLMMKNKEAKQRNVIAEALKDLIFGENFDQAWYLGDCIGYMEFAWNKQQNSKLPFIEYWMQFWEKSQISKREKFWNIFFSKISNCKNAIMYFEALKGRNFFNTFNKFEETDEIFKIIREGLLRYSDKVDDVDMLLSEMLLEENDKNISAINAICIRPEQLPEQWMNNDDIICRKDTGNLIKYMTKIKGLKKVLLSKDSHAYSPFAIALSTCNIHVFYELVAALSQDELSNELFEKRTTESLNDFTLLGVIGFQDSDKFRSLLSLISKCDLLEKLKIAPDKFLEKQDGKGYTILDYIGDANGDENSSKVEVLAKFANGEFNKSIFQEFEETSILEESQSPLQQALAAAEKYEKRQEDIRIAELQRLNGETSENEEMLDRFYAFANKYNMPAYKMSKDGRLTPLSGSAESTESSLDKDNDIMSLIRSFAKENNVEIKQVTDDQVEEMYGIKVDDALL